MSYLRKLRSFGVNSDILETFYNAVICSIIAFGSVCWGGNISQFDRGRLEKILKKKQVMLWECHWTVLRHSLKNNLKKKTNENIKWSYTPNETLLWYQMQQQEWKIFTPQNKYKPLQGSQFFLFQEGTFTPS